MVIGSTPIECNIIIYYYYYREEVAEWLKAVDCKSIERGSTSVRIRPSSFKCSLGGIGRRSRLKIY